MIFDKQSNGGRIEVESYRPSCLIVCRLVCWLTAEFVVDPESGVIFTRRPLDRETLSHYTLHVRAQSDVTSASGDGDDVTVVFIQVLDANDHAPEVTYPLPGNEVHFQQKAVQAGEISFFLLRDAYMRSASLLSKDGWLDGCPSHAGIVSKRLKISSNFFSAL